jgi:hypothetical protein
MVARFWTIRQLSLSMARALQEDRAPAVEAAMVKDLGTTFEQKVVATIQPLVEDDPDPGSSSFRVAAGPGRGHFALVHP